MHRTFLSSAICVILTAQFLPAASVYDYELTTINYERVHLRDFKGKVLMIVNVASHCGYTPQYAGLEKLYLAHKDQGFVIIGVPSNDFGQGEPGSDREIKQFCRRKYDVTFPMMSKVFIEANPRSPLYEFLTDERQNPKTGGEIKWNFTKFLISRGGTIVARFEPDVEPEDPSLIAAVENALRQIGVDLLAAEGPADLIWHATDTRLHGIELWKGMSPQQKLALSRLTVVPSPQLLCSLENWKNIAGKVARDGSGASLTRCDSFGAAPKCVQISRD